VKFYYQSIQDATVTTTITPDTGSPVTNLQDRNNNTTFSGTVAVAAGQGFATQTITIDLGSSTAVDHIIIDNIAVGGTHPGAATLLLVGDDNSGFTTPEFMFSGEDISGGGRIIKTFTSATYRYWRITIYDSDSLGDSFTFAATTIFMGASFEPSRNPDLNNGISYEFSSTVTEALGGGRFAFGDHDNERMNWIYNFDYISETDRTGFIALFRGIYAGEMSRYPFYFADPSGTVHYGRLVGVPQITEIGYQAYTTALDISEEI